MFWYYWRWRFILEEETLRRRFARSLSGALALSQHPSWRHDVALFINKETFSSFSRLFRFALLFTTTRRRESSRFSRHSTSWLSFNDSQTENNLIKKRKFHTQLNGTNNFGGMERRRLLNLRSSFPLSLWMFFSLSAVSLCFPSPRLVFVMKIGGKNSEARREKCYLRPRSFWHHQHCIITSSRA